MHKPLIGISTRTGQDADSHPTAVLQYAYIQAIASSGGIPVPIVSNLSDEGLNDLYDRLDGIVFSGGGDIAVDHYDGETHPSMSTVDDARDATEIFLLKQSVDSGKPALGICRGAQIMNVSLGGTLYSHLPDQYPGSVDHQPGSDRKKIAHLVNIDESSMAAEIFGETLLHVNSLHHQGIKDLAPNLRAVGYAPDGLIEMVEVRDHPFGLAVQWHPEWLLDQPPMQKLFIRFIAACGG
jgi:putative glutamine amidotransferase